MTQAASPDHFAERLRSRLSGTLDRSVAADMVAKLEGAGSVPAVLSLFDELADASAKATQAAIEALPELDRRGALGSVVPWLDLGVALAGSSGAVAMKYFKESPLLLGLIETEPARRQALDLALELADSDVNVALELIRQAPELLAVLPAERWPAWAGVGVELARMDFVLGIEFFRQSPALAAVLPLEQVRAWVGFGMKLIQQNSLGKTDYVGTLEFFRTSPMILGDVPEPAVRGLVVQMGSVLADRAPEAAIAFLAESPALLRRMPTEAWRLRCLQYGLLVGERDAESALAYWRRCPDILALTGAGEQAQDKFELWYRGGMEVLGYSPEGARAYFALETKKALESVTQAVSGVPLRQVARSLKLFAQGLCGTDVTIRSLPDTEQEPAKGQARATVSDEGRTIALPAILRRYDKREDNVRLYTVMTAHEAGHLEFGTYGLALGRLAELIRSVRARYGRTQEPANLAEVFALYPQPGLIRDLWTLLEDARVEYLLQLEYPGLKNDLAALARDAARTRSLLHGMTVREMVVDALLLLSTQDREAFRIPESIAEVVELAWTQCRAILAPGALAEDAVRLADRVYVLLDDMLAAKRPTGEGEASEPSADVGAGPTSSEETAEAYRPVTNWAYRGEMNPELVTDRGAGGEDKGEHPQGLTFASAEAFARGGAAGRGSQGRQPRELTSDEVERGRDPGSVVDHWLAVDEGRAGAHQAEPAQAQTFLYDEWDGLIQDYRQGWCRVVERAAPEGATDFAEATLAEHGAAVRLLRRYFEALRPPGLRRVSGQTDGEELDLDAVVRRRAELAAGADSSDRLYVRREKCERDVAAAFLVDLSGSTSRQIESAGGRTRRVIDIEKEGLVLLGEALEAIGDRYAVYGYSGRGRRQVDFVILKEFDEPAGLRMASRLGAVEPLQQNRDGAAIRHATRKLLAQPAKVRLLVLLSDGKPLDEGYTDEYSLEDTKAALREARAKGLDPFCITVDREADDYLKRMYGEVRYLIMDHAGALPEQLPRTYHRLTA
ncbi:MAG: hypothetical protein KGI53_03295 [Nitrospirota bacterium]|nr:hypothetical protein [Nitrospirota bacterium]